ncbi:tetratricopeptide repeat protein [Luteolibacter sp. AS25]|uniref:tetratricopeptide repeat protein n=1 Tax=Luteolibacter sp. AS25 TaxID=3135776 RepID=UPI00398ACD7C
MNKVLLAVILATSAMEAGADPLVDFTFGVIHELRNEQELAGEFYEKAYLADPTSLPLVRMETQRLLSVGDRAAAIDAYKLLIEARPDDPLINIEFGDFMGSVARGDTMALQLQEKAYRKVLEVYPGDYMPIERLIRLAREQRNDGKARSLLEELQLDRPESILYYMATTKSLYDNQDAEAAERVDRVLENGMDDHPEAADLAREASDHFRETGRKKHAIELLQAHVDAAPSSLDLKVRLGILMFTAGRNQEGVEILKEVLSIHPGKVSAHVAMTKYYRINGMAGEARSHSVELLKIRGGSPSEFIELAEELMNDSEFREARLLLEKAVFDHEDDAGLYMKLAMATARDPETKSTAGRMFREAEKLLEIGGEMEPGFMLDSANQLLAQGETKAAEDRLRTAIRMFPKEAKNETAAALRALAGIWISEGKNENAAKALIQRAEALEK